MPYVEIKITKEDNTPEQKADLIKGVTSVLENILNKDPKTTFVVIEEVPLENWGIAGTSVQNLRSGQ